MDLTLTMHQVILGTEVPQEISICGTIRTVHVPNLDSYIFNLVYINTTLYHISFDVSTTVLLIPVPYNIMQGCYCTDPGAT